MVCHNREHVEIVRAYIASVRESLGVEAFAGRTEPRFTEHEAVNGKPLPAGPD